MMMTKPKTTPMAYGFTDFNGNVWHDAEVDAYNQLMTKPKTTPMAYGFKDFNGNVWHDAEVDAYNQYNTELERARHPETVEFLLDQRHRLFVLIVDSYNTINHN